MTCRISLALIPLLLAAICGCQPGSSPLRSDDAKAADSGAGAAVRVTPIRPVRKTLVRRTEQPGQIEAYEETPLYAKLTGFVKKLNVDIGDRVTGPQYDRAGRLVRPGQVLAELSIPELDAELRQKQALVVQSRAEVKQAAAAVKVAGAALASAQARVTQAQALVERDEAKYLRWKSELARFRDLAEKGAVTKKLVDETESEFHAADSSRRETAARVKSAEAGAVESAALLEKARADAEAVAAKLNVALADEQRIQALLDYAVIRAPFDGVISARNVHTGHLVQAATGSGNPLFVVVRTDVVRIFVDVPETDAPLIVPGNEARVRVASLGQDRVKGTVKRTAWALNAQTRTLRTEIDVENTDGKLRPGMYAYADVKVAERPNALVLPRAAVLTSDSETYCYCIDAQGKVVRTPFVAGLRSGDEVEVVSGLTGDEQVIAANAASFRDGQIVEVPLAQTLPGN